MRILLLQRIVPLCRLTILCLAAKKERQRRARFHRCCHAMLAIMAQHSQTLLFIAMDAGQAGHHLDRQWQRADDILVYPYHQLRVYIIRIDLQHPVVVVAACSASRNAEINDR